MPRKKKKFQHKKTNFAKVTSEKCRTRQLLVIDDSKIRQQAYSGAAKILKKMDSLENAIELFNSEDQNLFNSWHDITFREEQKKIAIIQDKYRTLSVFHNWIVAVSHIEKLSMPEAYKFTTDEQARYDSGDTKTRQEIEEARKRRDDFIHAEMEKEFSSQRAEFDEFGDDEAVWDDDSIDDDSIDKGSPEYIANKQFVEKIRKMSGKKLRQTCQNGDEALYMLASLISAQEYIGEGPECVRDFLRVWDLCSHKVKSLFSQSFRKSTGSPIEVMIQEMRELVENYESVRLADSAPPEDAAGGADEADINENYFSIGGHVHKKQTTPKPEQQELLKLVYRKLVRKLHPDMLLQKTDTKIKPWQHKIWNSAQRAYKNNDLSTLTQLSQLTALRFKDLSDMTLSEIHASEVWLTTEFESLQREARNLKSLPAWGFSKKTNYDSLLKKIRKEYDRTYADIDGQVQELLAQHQVLQMLSQQPRSRPVRKKYKARRAARKPVKNSVDYGQRTFFDS